MVHGFPRQATHGVGTEPSRPVAEPLLRPRAESRRAARIEAVDKTHRLEMGTGMTFRVSRPARRERCREPTAHFFRSGPLQLTHRRGSKERREQRVARAAETQTRRGTEEDAAITPARRCTARAVRRKLRPYAAEQQQCRVQRDPDIVGEEPRTRTELSPQPIPAGVADQRRKILGQEVACLGSRGAFQPRRPRWQPAMPPVER